MINVESRRYFASLAALAVGVASCSKLELDKKHAPSGLDKELALKNSPIFVYDLPGTKPGRNIVEFYWSPTCIFSAQIFRDKIYPLVNDRKFMSSHSVRAYMLARNEKDVEFFLTLRPYKEFGLLSSTLLMKSASANALQPIQFVRDAAKAYGISQSNNQVESNHIRHLTSYSVETRKITSTPSLLLNGKKVEFT